MFTDSFLATGCVLQYLCSMYFTICVLDRRWKDRRFWSALVHLNLIASETVKQMAWHQQMRKSPFNIEYSCDVNEQRSPQNLSYGLEYPQSVQNKNNSRVPGSNCNTNKDWTVPLGVPVPQFEYFWRKWFVAQNYFWTTPWQLMKSKFRFLDSLLFTSDYRNDLNLGIA
jgi:hypothetical protein